MLIIDFLVSHIRSAANFNKHNQVAPAAILWTDSERQWQSAIPLIKQHLPELVELGAYDPEMLEQRMGPAVWIKCAISGLLPELKLPADKTPIIYLPGIARKDLRAIELCPEYLQPLAELQYRGCWWATPNNNRDWTITGFLSNNTVGLSLDIAKDAKTAEALSHSLEEVLLSDSDFLKGKRLDAEDFNRLIAEDPIKDVLLWMNKPSVFDSWQSNKQQVFSTYCINNLALDPTSASKEKFATALCERQGAWQAIWERFCDIAAQLPELLELLENIHPVGLALEPSSYLSINNEDERSLSEDFAKLLELAPEEARTKIGTLYEKNKARCNWVWVSLGRSPYLSMLVELNNVAQLTELSFGGADAVAMAKSYENKYWKADFSAYRAYALAKDDSQRSLVAKILSVIYSPWLRAVAKNFQERVVSHGYPGVSDSQRLTATAPYAENSQVVFFVDGLRYDTAQSLKESLQNRLANTKVNLSSHWSALPSLTATSKAAVTPVNHLLAGLEENDDFVPVIKETGQSFSAHHFKKALEKEDWQYLNDLDTGDVEGKAWLQTGDIDKTGHKEQVKLPTRIDSILEDVASRVAGLIEAGWENIRIVTDHGWLWVPDTLPKAEISKDVTRNRLVRCAILKDNASTEYMKAHWHWNANVTIAMAPDISGFTAGLYYDHGGVSLQECLTPVLNISVVN